MTLRELPIDSAGRTLLDYPRPSVAVDTALLTVPDDASSLHVLLVRRGGSHRRGAWALPGTFLHEGELLAEAVLRSLREKAGVEGVEPRQLHVFDDPDRDDRGRVLSVAHVDVVAWRRLERAVAARDDVCTTPIDEAAGLPFDHDEIVKKAVEHVRARYAGTPDPDRLLAGTFTLYELRRLHEAVLGTTLLKDTFRRLMQPQLRPTDRHRAGEVGKPARIFRRS